MKKRHIETHIRSSKFLQDVVIGMSDGLTVPFALAAGLSGAVDSNKIILAAGLAEIAAGAVAMGLGGYLATKTAIQHYKSEEAKEFSEIKEVPDVEKQEVAEILEKFGIDEKHLAKVTETICSNPRKWVDFMMRFELGLEKPNPKLIFVTPITIGLSYVFGGLIPILPYILKTDLTEALYDSIMLTVSALLIFGGLKGYFTGTSFLRSSIDTTLVGGLAAAAAFTLGKMLS